MKTKKVINQTLTSTSERTKKPNLKDKLWKIFSEYIRLRDADWNGYAYCISCGKTAFWKDLDAGHFISKNSGDYFYFLEDNVNAQCPHCNRFLHGNLLNYRRGLICKIGEEEVDKLEYQSQLGVRLELNKEIRLDYEDLIRVYRDKLNELKKNKCYERQ